MTCVVLIVAVAVFAKTYTEMIEWYDDDDDDDASTGCLGR